jgi:hypothetical protein
MAGRNGKSKTDFPAEKPIFAGYGLGQTQSTSVLSLAT